MATVNGKNLVVKFGLSGSEEIVACSTSCTLNINQETIGTSCKDNTGNWQQSIEGMKSWDVTVDALYQDDDVVGSKGFVDLSLLIITGPNTTHIIFQDKDSPAEGNAWSGDAIMTSCSLTGDDNSPATYSATFTGNGVLTYIAKN